MSRRRASPFDSRSDEETPVLRVPRCINSIMDVLQQILLEDPCSPFFGFAPSETPVRIVRCTFALTNLPLSGIPSRHRRPSRSPMTPLSSPCPRACNRWNTLQSRNVQVAFIEEFGKRQCGIQLPNLSLAEALGLTVSHVRTIRAKARKKQKSPHRPLSLTGGQDKEILEMVREEPLLGFMSHKEKY
jgi:hypothetical protein